MEQLEIGPLDLAKLTYGNYDSKKLCDMSSKEVKVRNEVASNFMKFFNIKLKTK